MDFSDALRLLKAGCRMARHAWVVDGKWVVYRTGYMDGGGIPVNGNTAEAFGIPEGTPVRFRPYFQMCEKDGTLRTWNKGDDDILGDDWYEVVGVGNLDPANRGVIRLDADEAPAPYEGTVVFEDAEGNEVARGEGPVRSGHLVEDLAVIGEQALATGGTLDPATTAAIGEQSEGCAVPPRGRNGAPITLADITEVRPDGSKWIPGMGDEI